MMPMLESEGGK